MYNLYTQADNYRETIFTLVSTEAELQHLRADSLEKNFIQKAIVVVQKTLYHLKQELQYPSLLAKPKYKIKYHWTESISDFVELTYALIESRSIEYGDIEIKEFVAYLAEIFGVDVKDSQTTYMGIKHRKTDSRTHFLDRLGARAATLGVSRQMHYCHYVMNVKQIKQKNRYIMLLSYKKSLYKDFPYPVVGVDLRSPNIKLIDEQLDVLGQEIVRMLDINSRTDKDKIENAKWWAGVLYYGSKYSLSPLHSPIRYLFEGINDHGFDINSPELRNKHLHWSATTGKTALVFEPHAPNFEQQALTRIRYEDN